MATEVATYGGTAWMETGGLMSLDIGGTFWGELLAEDYRDEMLLPPALDSECEGLFEAFDESSAAEPRKVSPPRPANASGSGAVGGGVGDEQGGWGEESDEAGEENEVPTAQQVEQWQSKVVEFKRERTWRDHIAGTLQSRCFTVEWKGSPLVQKDDFVRRVFGALGGKVSFVLGTEIRTSTADYYMVVRCGNRARWRDWRKKLMFGHGGQGDFEEGFFMRVRVPRWRTVEGINVFLRDAMQKCEGYGETSRYRESEMSRVQSRPGRPGRAMDVT
jgi:hypothetical protein